MKLNLNEVQQLDAHQILEILLPTINKLYKTVDYTGITKDEFYNLVLKEINKSKINYKGDIIYTDYIKKIINIVLDEQIKNILSKKETAIIIINNYINKCLKQSATIEDSLNNLKKMDKFFKIYNYIPDYDILIQIIKENPKFYNMIESIVKKYQVQIIAGNMEEIFDDETTKLIIEAYCTLNNIEINEEKDDIDLNNYELTDSLKAYFHEISRIPVLSLEDEQKLVKRIAQGDSYAREIFIESNLKLVVSIAKRYVGRGLPFLDLIQEGNLGLITAVDKYDINKETRFSTYANHWIKHSINRALANKGRNVRIPVYVYEKIGTYKKVVNNLELKLNRQPTMSEIANKMNLSISEVIKLHKLQKDTLSINTIIDDEDNEMEQFISSFVKTPEDMVIASTMKYQVREFIDKCNLKPRDKEILLLIFGFNNKEPMKLEKVGEKFNLSPERVRQIKLKSLQKMKNSKYKNLLIE